ncbi:MAG: end-binding protein Ku [Ilumatobacteraceae bacterium]|nr:end-binding protein Ku [Ilumatobacteraceae bacterium]
MARPVWTGSISFGMVSIPIRLVPAVRKKSISFNQLDDQTMSRIRYRKVSEATGEEVSQEHIVKAFDMGAENYVLVTDDDLAPLAPAKSKEIGLEVFVPTDDLNPLMFDASYLIIPDKTPKPYALLATAMAGSGRVGIGRFVMRQKEYLAAVRSDGTYLTLSTLVFPDELVDIGTVEGFETLDDVDISDKELLMAKSLVEALSEDFQPADYRDEYRLAVEQIIEQKAAGKVPVFEDAPAAKATVIDLASALEASLRDAKEARAGHPSATSLTAAHGGKSGAKKAAAKKAAPSKAAAKKAAAAPKPAVRARKSA